MSSVKLKRTSLPAKPIMEETNGELPKDRRASTIVPSMMEGLSIGHQELAPSTSTAQQNKARYLAPDQITRNTNTPSKHELNDDINNDSGIVINIEDSEDPDFVYPRMYTSTLNVVIK